MQDPQVEKHVATELIQVGLTAVVRSFDSVTVESKIEDIRSAKDQFIKAQALINRGLGKLEELAIPVGARPALEDLEKPEEVNLTVSQVAEILNLDPSGVRARCRKGSLAGQKIGPRAWIVPISALERFLIDHPLDSTKPGPKKQGERTSG